MFIRILKRDLKRKKGVTVIIFLFMLMAVLFISVSVNNIFRVMSATDYSMEKGKVPDVYINAFTQKDGRNIEDWLDNNELVTDYSVYKSVFVFKGNIKSFKGCSGDEYHMSETVMAQSQWENLMPLYDSDGKPARVKVGEVAMCEKAMKENNLKAGDTITFTFGDYEKTFTVAEAVQDPALGSDFTSMGRYFFNEEDYKQIEANNNEISLNYGINTRDSTKFLKDYNKQGYSSIIILEKSLFEMTYVMSLVVAAVLIVVGICLIIISFLVLRFTIVFTIEEEYKEIGIMKAIGIKNIHIRMLYLVKYFVLISISSVIGCGLSIPLSEKSLDMVVAGNMMMPEGRSSIILNIASAIVTMMIVMLLSLTSTRKIKKFSAIEAIRNGTTGERYTRKSIISLKNAKHISTTFFMAVNDIFSELKKYVVLLLTFVMGTILIILALNTITSLTSEEMAKNFAIDTDADFYLSVDTLVTTGGDSLFETDSVDKIIARLKEDINSAGYNCDINVMNYRMITFYKKNSNDVLSFMTSQPVNSDGKYIDIKVGETPLLENEIAMSVKAMNELGVKVGDTICAKIGAEEREFIITGKYANYMQLGKSVLASETTDLSAIPMAGLSYFQVTLTDVKDEDKAEAFSNIKKALPNLVMLDEQDVVANNLGSEMDKFNNLKVLIVLLVCGINMLITILMIKIFIVGEKDQIAMLRAIGFSTKQLKLWQMFRIGTILLMATILGILCSLFLNNLILKPIFAMMGAVYMKIHINYIEAYCIYPLVLLVVTCISAFVSAGKLKKLKIMEINNIE